MNYLQILKDWVLPIIYGVLIPFISMMVGAKITKRQAEKDSKRAEEVQQEKILNLLKHEIQLFIKHKDKNGSYRVQNQVYGLWLPICWRNS